MPVISRNESVAECDALMEAAVAARDSRDTEATIEALRACLAHPCAVHEFQTTELWSELAGEYRSVARYDEAMDAWENAIATGYRGLPHPRAEIAELLLMAGRRAEADALYADLRGKCADDVWLYNSAGWSYQGEGDHEEALRWLDAGIELTLATGDPEDIRGQLADFRAISMKAIGRDPHDELAARVDVFERPSGSWRSVTHSYGEVEPVSVRCEHCGWNPSDEKATHMPLTEVEALSRALGRSGRARGVSELPARSNRVQSAPEERAPKIGRNQPCSCGSGSKFKHCCM